MACQLLMQLLTSSLLHLLLKCLLSNPALQMEQMLRMSWQVRQGLVTQLVVLRVREAGLVAQLLLLLLMVLTTLTPPAASMARCPHVLPGWLTPLRLQPRPGCEGKQ